MKLNEEQIVLEVIERLDGDYLAHYGVQGMKWGVRKERPTSGRARRAKVKLKKLAGKTYSSTKGAYQKLKQIRHKREVAKVDRRLEKKGRLRNKDVAKLSYKELQERIDLVNKRKQLTNSNSEARNKIVSMAGDVLLQAAKTTASSYLTKQGQNAVDRLLKIGKYEEDEATSLNVNVKNLGDKALQKAIDRARKEKEYKDLTAPSKSMKDLLSKSEDKLTANEAQELSKYLKNIETIREKKGANKPSPDKEKDKNEEKQNSPSVGSTPAESVGTGPQVFSKNPVTVKSPSFPKLSEKEKARIRTQTEWAIKEAEEIGAMKEAKAETKQKRQEAIDNAKQKVASILESIGNSSASFASSSYQSSYMRSQIR